MSKTKRMKKDNYGFSLMELVISMAIVSIVSVAVFEFVMVATRHYQRETREVELQYEAQLTMNQLQDMLIDATKGVSYMVNGSTLILSDSEIPAGPVTSKQVIVYNTDRYYVIEWRADQEKILYSEYSRNADNTWNLIADNILMAEYVHQFSADLSFFDRNNSIGLDVVFNNEREYRMMQNVKLRNQVSVNASVTELYGS